MHCVKVHLSNCTVNICLDWLKQSQRDEYKKGWEVCLITFYRKNTLEMPAEMSKIAVINDNITLHHLDHCFSHCVKSSVIVLIPGTLVFSFGSYTSSENYTSSEKYLSPKTSPFNFLLSLNWQWEWDNNHHILEPLLKWHWTINNYNINPLQRVQSILLTFTKHVGMVKDT